MSVISSVSARSSNGSLAFSSGSIDTTGATLLVAALVWNGTEPTLNDSVFNSWVPLTSRATGGKNIRLYWVANPATSATHIFSVGASASSFATLAVAAFGVVNAFDLESGATHGSGATIQPGAITPSNAVSLVVAAVSNQSVFNTMSIDSSFTQLFNLTEGSFSDALGFAYKVKASATAENPTWTFVSGAAAETVMASFIVGAAADTADHVTQMVLEAATAGSGESRVTQMVLELLLCTSDPVIPVDIIGSQWKLYRFDARIRSEETS